MHSHIRGLKALAEQLEKATTLIASGDTVSPAVLEFFLWKLSLASALLTRRLRAIREQALETQESGPQTSAPL